ncbi:MAG: cytochrome c3 family protein [Candidatus Marinimicrobia bacterium]|nr:cytochrome c3 family protein [Candidatus Neomarinimicrobiota bacterium]
MMLSKQGCKILFLALLTASLLSGQTAPENALIFSHDLHVNEEGLDCLDCHPDDDVENSMLATDRLLPDEDACMTCHDDWQEDETCERCHTGEQPFVARIFPPENFLFPHQSHLSVAKLECEICHGNMSDIENTPPQPLMADCISCHIDRSVSTACQDCHAPNFVLRPANHSVDWLQEHEIEALTASSDCLQCHVQITCDNCHSGSNLGRDDFGYLNPLPTFRTDLQGERMTLDRVHDLNYEFTHGIDADTKLYECGSCHETQTFCTDCHQNNSNPLLNKPQFHGGLNWGAIKYPMGTDFSNNIDGGAHAELARMDIERCQSCHDVEGADPNCVSCHSDVDGVQFTDPRTHLPGFMSDVQGDWCESESSMCFVCHTKEDKGLGFCAYCHQ